MVLGFFVILTDFFATALPETVETTTRRVTEIIAFRKKVAINRKTVVAPFVDGMLSNSLPGEGDSSAPELSSTLVPDLVPIMESENSSSSVAIPSSSNLPISSDSIIMPGPRMSQTDHGRQQPLAKPKPATAARDTEPTQMENAVIRREPAKLVRKSTARKAEDLF